MKRSRVPLVTLALALVLAACGGASSDTTGANGAPDGSTTSVTIRPGGSIEGPAAPDFTIALGADGGESFTLSDAATPVYMVFWAEW